jgi:uncharacterized protein YcbX
MTIKISSIHFCPVKSVSYQTIDQCNIQKDIGLEGDRVFALLKNIETDDPKLIDKEHEVRKGKWNKILTLKNTPALNKYNFSYGNEQLTLYQKDQAILSINSNDTEERKKLVNKIIELENSINDPLVLMKNNQLPYFDTTISTKVDFVNSVSLLNIESIKDFRNKTKNEIEVQRFRGNFLMEGVNAWEERNWIGKIITIGSQKFHIKKNIPRCVAINIKPETDDKNLDLLRSLKEHYQHFDMGLYLVPLSSGKITKEDTIKI